MQIERLRLLNFRQHEDTELVLGAGLTGIIGPNGAGKTTLLEAIAWALYGADAARGTRETIRRRGAGPRAPVKVELDFALGPHRYRAVRTLNGAELYQDNDTAPVANSLQAVTEKVSRLLGMTREEFFNTYFTGQKQLAVMAAMKPVERAQFLARVLGYDRLQRAQERLREERTRIRATLTALEAQLPDPAALDREAARAAERQATAARLVAEAVAAMEAAERRRGEVAPRWQEMQAKRDQVAAIQGDLRLADHRVQTARERFQQLDRELVGANEARGRLEGLRQELAPLEELRAERHRLDELAGQYAKRQVAQAQLEETRALLQQVRARAARLPAPELLERARVRLAEYRQRHEALEEAARERRSAWDRDLQDARTKREALRDQYKELKDQLDKITQTGPDGACPTCERPLRAEYPNVVGILDRQLQDVLFNGNYFKSRIDQLAAEPAELKELERQRAEAEKSLAHASAEMARLETQAQEGPGLTAELVRLDARAAELALVAREGPANYDPNRHSEVRRMLAALDPVALQAERLRVAAERAEALVTEAESAERELTGREAEARALRDRLQALGYSDEAWGEARAAAEGADRARREGEMAAVRARAEQGAAAEAATAVERRREERTRREEEARRAARDLLLHNELDRAFTDLRTDLNQQLRPDLAELASGFLRDLSNGRYGELELDEDYVATIIEGGEPKPVISGGEEDIANLALRLAISQMIADRAGQPLSLLVLDEIFGSLDEERRAAVVDLLRSLADRFPQVILITHIEGVREGMDRVVRVDLDGERGVARVHDDLGGGTGDGLAA
ncbi:MAG: SMC family ATPase [Gemmatimonadetes bacterium]|nr:SMC family ATPase [Gemmatimonadota bacterium]MBK7783961.1 SMC family ATPase [Gemmatimonadota bacterium]